MRLIAHLVRADVRQFRWTILLWLVLVAAETVLTGMRPAFATDMRVYSNLGMILDLLWYALQLGTLLIVPLVVQAHPAVGTVAFWMTRPIPPRTLFASKAVLLVTLTVLVPCAARLALMLWIGVPVREGLFVSLDSAIAQTAWLAVLVAGAAVTLNLPRFALLCGAVYLSLVLLITVLIMRARTGEFTATATLSVGQPVRPPSPDPTEGIIFLCCVIAAGAVLAAIQYRTRLRRVSVPAGVGGLVLVAFAIPHWPFPLLAVPSALPAWARNPDAARLHAASPVIELTSGRSWTPATGIALTTGRARVIVSRVESGWLPRLSLAAASLTLGNGATLASRGRGYQSEPQTEGSSDNPSRVVARDVLGVEHAFLSAATPGSELATTLVLPASEIDPVTPATGTYRGQFHMYLTHWEAAAALSLRAGAVFQDDAYRFAIERVDTGPGDEMTVRAREWRATSSFDRKPPIAYTFFMRNAQHSHAIAGRASEPFEGIGAVSGVFPFFLHGASPASFFVRAVLVSFPPAYGLQEERVDWDPDWYADAELVVVRMTDAGAVLRTLDMPQASLVAKR